MDTNDQSITIIKTFDAPIEKVWDAWTTKEGWAAWYGHPWENPIDKVELDVQPGGEWKSTTIANGQEINFVGNYKEVRKPERLVMVFKNPNQPAGGPDDPNVEIVMVDLKNLGDGKCEMTFTQSGNLPPEEYQKGLKDGWTGFFDALEKYLSQA
jgi:uncharacterized protein YndB with AHSA1/START domain